MAIKRSTEERLTVSGPPQAWLSACKQALASGGFTKVQVSGGKITADYHKATVYGSIELALQSAGPNTIILAKATAAVDNIYTLFKSPMQTILTEFKSRLPSSALSGQSSAHAEPSYLDAATPAAPQVSCPHCKGLIATDPSLAGQQVSCPHCNSVLTMPGAATPKRALPVARQAAATPVPAGNVAAVSQPAAASSPSTIQCPHCGGKIGNDPRFAGRQVSCPHCKQPFAMPSLTPVAPVRAVASPVQSVEVIETAEAPTDFLDSISAPDTTPRYPHSTFKKPAKKKTSWPLWVRIVLPAFGIMILLCGGLRGIMSGGGEVELVKTGHLNEYPNITIGKAADNFLGNPQWESGVASDGSHCVNVRGDMTYMNRKVKALIQFEVDRKSGNLGLTAVEFNGVPQGEAIQDALIAKMFGGN